MYPILPGLLGQLSLNHLVQFSPLRSQSGAKLGLHPAGDELLVLSQPLAMLWCGRAEESQAQKGRFGLDSSILGARSPSPGEARRREHK